MTGGSANLFLINPAGIIFGANASLNVPAAFTATTATGISFGNQWFNAIGANNYDALTGTPNQLGFAVSQPGVIINAGNLAVKPGENLTLLGGTVINTGTLSAPGGQITIASVPGTSLVRLSQTGSLLSLEVQPIAGSSSLNSLPFTPLSLPELLTGGHLTNATGIVVAPDGTVRLSGSETIIPTQAGTAIASGTLDVSPSSAIAAQTGGTIQILGQRVGLVSATLQASGTEDGGTVLIGGDYKGQGTTPTADRTYVDSNSAIHANALQVGHGGRVIVWANDTTGFYGSIAAQGGNQSGNGGFVEVSGKQTLLFQGTVDTSAASGQAGTLLLDPRNLVIVNGNGGSSTNNNQLNTGVPTNDLRGRILAGHSITEDFTISESALENLPETTNVRLEATDNITINDLADNTLSFASNSGRTITFTADADGNGIGSFAMNSGDTLQTQGASVQIFGAGITTGNINTAIPGSSATSIGSINLTSSGAITTGNITAESSSINLSSRADIKTGDILIDDNLSNQGNSIAVSSQTGNIEVATIRNTTRTFGENTIQVSAFGSFRATGSVQVTFTQLPGNSEFPRVENLPVSVGVSLSGNSTPIRVFYAGATTADPKLSTVSTHPQVSGRSISIGGDGAPFSVGPAVIGKINPNAGELVGNTRNELYAPRPIPDGISGTVGAIIIGGGGNANLFTSIQDIPFISTTTVALLVGLPMVLLVGLPMAVQV